MVAVDFPQFAVLYIVGITCAQFLGEFCAGVAD